MTTVWMCVCVCVFVLTENLPTMGKCSNVAVHSTSDIFCCFHDNMF